VCCVLEGHEDDVYKKLQQVEHLTVYKKEDIPKEFHYSNSRRITPIVVTAALGFHICQNASACFELKGKGQRLLIGCDFWKPVSNY
jgi:hypothetical protein